ncbi:MAG: phosphoribosylamine--glycine ligase [bacterium JZ-2024 1]
MKIGVIGKGAREHAIAWRLSRSPSCERVFLFPGNPGASDCAVLRPETSREAIAEFCKTEGVSLLVIGPEAPLANGDSDFYRAQALDVVGPGASGARLESSKAFAKEFFTRHRIPTANFRTLTEYESALAFAENHSFPLVVKADGLAGGKGAFVCPDLPTARSVLHDLFIRRTLGSAGIPVVIEDYLRGEEISLIALVSVEQDSATSWSFPLSQDHKRLLSGERGPNTGGMGAYAPVPQFSNILPRLESEILNPLLKALASEGISYHGFLYVGLMMTEDGPRVLEINVRMGDPEAQVILPLIEGDFAEACLRCARGEPFAHLLTLREGFSALGVVLASSGYPFASDRGTPIFVPPGEFPDGFVFYAGVSRVGNLLVTDGGRILTAVGLGTSLSESADNAYAIAESIEFAGKRFRSDIGWRAFHFLSQSCPSGGLR